MYSHFFNACFGYNFFSLDNELRLFIFMPITFRLRFFARLLSDVRFPNNFAKNDCKEIITGPEPAPVVDVIYEEIKHRLPTTYDEVFTFTKIYQPINTSLN